MMNVKPIVGVVIYALAERRVGAQARNAQLAYNVWMGVHLVRKP